MKTGAVKNIVFFCANKLIYFMNHVVHLSVYIDYVKMGTRAKLLEVHKQAHLKFGTEQRSFFCTCLGLLFLCLNMNLR